MVYYVETSALAKLTWQEVHAIAMREWWAVNHRQAVSSLLTKTELVRAARRLGDKEEVRANQSLEAITLVGLGINDYLQAAVLDPRELRSLDALHFAVALALRPDLDGLVTYDKRLAQAAAQAGIPVVTPGQEATADTDSGDQSED